MKRPNVLVTAGSRRVPLVMGFKRALQRQANGGRVVVSDVNPLAPTVHLADAAYRVPLSTDPAYLDAIAAICDAEDIRVLVPTIDDELPVFAAARERFAAMGVWVVVSDLRAAEICNDKFETCRVLRAHGVAAARSYLPSTLPRSPQFPLFVKPRTGRGSVGAFAARNATELAFFLQYVDDPVIQEFLRGAEFTLDLFCDRRGAPLSVVPRERVVIRSGVMDRGRTVNDPRLIELALACARTLPFVGPINIQCRMHGDVPTVFEINPRFSGGIPLTIAAGADFPAMVLDLALHRRVAPAIGRFKANLWMTSFESALFLDAAQLDAFGAARPSVRLAEVG